MYMLTQVMLSMSDASADDLDLHVHASAETKLLHKAAGEGRAVDAVP